MITYCYSQYKKVKAGSGSENIIMSPFSVSAAMAMLYAGAQGLTKQQMRNVLRFNSFPSNCKVHEGFRLLLKAFSATTYNHTLKVVDRVFVDSSFRLLRYFLSDFVCVMSFLQLLICLKRDDASPDKEVSLQS